MKKDHSLFVFKLFFILIFTGIIFTNSFSQITVSIGSSKDNTLYDFPHGTISNGAGQHFFSGKTAGDVIRRGVIAFDLASYIPPCAVIQSASLRLHMSRAISGAAQIELRRLLEDWGEGASDALGEEGQGAQAEENDVTWDHTFYFSQFWSTSGGVFSNTNTASASVDGIGYYTWGSNSQMLSDVQNWVSGTQPNYGWLLLGDESSFPSVKRFDTKENDSVNFRPVLTVTYTINKVVLNLTNIMEGFWNGSSMIRDTVKVFLHNSSSPYAKVDSSKTFLNSGGKGLMCFNNASGGQYFIVVTHRNALETWSGTGQTFTTGSVKSYDFTTSSSQAYGNNLNLVSGKYCEYSGDPNQDGAVDASDIIDIYNDVTVVAMGYINTDVNGDDIVDASDLLLTYNNVTNVVLLVRP